MPIHKSMLAKEPDWSHQVFTLVQSSIQSKHDAFVGTLIRRAKKAPAEPGRAGICRDLTWQERETNEHKVYAPIRHKREQR